MIMIWYKILLLATLGICALGCINILFSLIKKGNAKDYAKPAGNPLKGVAYSMTGAMSPKRKESAYLHLPTYSAGLLYHFGTFLCLFLLILSFFSISYSNFLKVAFLGFIALTSLSGFGILIKRMVKSGLRSLSNPDDYISNFLVTIFQIATALVVMNWIPDMAYCLIVSLLLLYIPVGKLRHIVYFFAARYHLGWFYGYRGVWK
jgi:hypothetical protein